MPGSCAASSPARPGDKVNGRMRYLWQAVDQYGNGLHILVMDKRDAHAAKRLFRKLLKNLEYAAPVIETDKLHSYSAAHRQAMPSVE
ncbi:DDE-type integrase/transposase/recombinase [Streptomyces sp. ET3-23]|uniref:DDE-type integrase/transposase/recombinase n=1 Tax=Streptomyces sp. ET3-23 TaxID=2885643 RepID=UPI0027DF992F|nr:DDE-type integrase/transposase/recombinase [Streptomyces sp. ET3-23]